MTACMTVPYQMGGAITKMPGILQTYWLHIHVNVIIASYALIAASFVLGVVYLLMKLMGGRKLIEIDQANRVILQMAFWFLGIGIVTGAVWADYSWGRPWGWDPKETFALVTWLVYLIIVHVRLVVPKRKAETTAWLAIAGFAVMMFNWIGVNYFLAGLHSYA